MTQDQINPEPPLTTQPTAACGKASGALKVATILAVAVSLIGPVYLGIFSATSNASTDPSAVVHIASPWVNHAASFAFIVSPLWLLTVLIWALIRGLWTRVGLILIYGFFWVIGSAFSVVHALGPYWRAYGQASDASGKTYYFLKQENGEKVALATGKSGWFGIRAKIEIVEAGSPFHPVQIIRPAGAISILGQVYVGDGGVVAGIWEGNECYLAFDPKLESSTSRGDIWEISPFVLCGPKTELNKADVLDLLQSARAGHAELAAIREGLNHPNPAVREVAQKLLEAFAASASQPASNPTARLQTTQPWDPVPINRLTGSPVNQTTKQQ